MNYITFKNLVLSIFLILLYSNPINGQTLTPTGSLNNQRWLHQSEVLPNGNVIAFGGNNGNYLNLLGYSSSEIYNRTAGTWSMGNNLNQSRSYFTSHVLNDGSILAIGGEEAVTNTSLSSVEIYNPSTGVWSYKSHILNTLHSHTSVKLNNGNVLVAAGLPLNNKSQIYNTSIDHWNYSDTLSFSHGDGSSIVLLQNGKVLLTGGSDTPNRAEIYNPITGEWKLVTQALNQSRKYHTSIVLNNGNVLIVGGSLSQTTCEIFNPVNETFTTTGNLSQPKVHVRSSELADGRVLTYGLNMNTMPVEVYDPLLGTWNSYFSTALGAQEYTINTLNNGSLLISGGAIGGSGAISTTYLVDITENITCSAINLTSPVSGNTSICYGEDASVQVSSSQTGWGYQAFIAGNPVSLSVSGGGTITLNIPFEKLALGDNLIKIKAIKPSCNSRVLINQLTVNTSIMNTAATQLNLSNNITICSGDSVLISSSNSANSYLWSNGTQTQQLYAKITGYYWVQLRDASGCLSNASDTVFIGVLPAVTSFASSIPANKCINDNAFQLSISPLTGIWSGDGIVGNMFDPSIANIGTNEIIYEYCNLKDTFQITVDSMPAIPAINIYYDYNAVDSVCHGGPLKVWVISPSADVCYAFKVDGVQVDIECSQSNDFFFQTANMYNPFTISISGSVNNGSCSKDSVLFSDSLGIISSVSPVSVFTVHDTMCMGAPAVIGVFPSDTSMTYNLHPYNQTPVQGNGDTLYLSSQGNYFRAQTFNNQNCNFNLSNNVNVYYKDFYENFDLPNSSGIFAVNELISLDTVWNKNKFVWDIDSVIYNGNVPSFVSFNQPGSKNISINGTLEAACNDSSSYEIQIFDTISNAPYLVCKADTLEGEFSTDYQFERTNAYHIDNMNNSYFAGLRDINYPHGFGLFLKKFNSNGDLLWEMTPITQYPDDLALSSINGIDVDRDGHIYIAGNYSAKTFRIGSLSFTHNTNSRSNNGFVAKLDTNGQLLWLINTEVNNNVKERGFSDVKIDPMSGKIYVSGYLLQDIRFPNGSLINFNNEFAVLEIDSSGHLVNTFSSGNVIGYNKGLDASWDPHLSAGWTGATISPKLKFRNGNIIVSGVYQENISIGSFTLNATFGYNYPQTDYYAFVATLDPSIGWNNAFTTFQVKHPNNSGSPYKTSVSPLLTIDDQGDYYMSIEIDNSSNSGIYIDQQQFVSFSSWGYNTLGSVLVKYDSTGNYLWHSKTTQFSPTSIDFTNNQLLLYGDYGSRFNSAAYNGATEALGVTDALSHSNLVKSHGYKDAAILSFNSVGNLNWIESIGGDDVDLSIAMAVKNCGKDIYLAGVSPTGNVNCFNDSLNVVRNYQLFQIKYSLIDDCNTNCIDCFEIVDGGVYQTNHNINICQGDSALIYGVYQNSSNVYYDSLQAINGCDSIHSITLNVNNYNLSQNQSICQGDSVLLAGSYQTIAGIFVDSLQSTLSCDSVVTTTLTIDPLPIVNITDFNPDTICINSSLLMLPNAIPTGGSFSGIGLAGASFDPLLAGVGTHDIIYTYTDSNSCVNSDTTIITVDICTGIDNVSSDFGILIYPNPSTGLFTIEKPSNLNKEVQISVLDVTSKLIIEKVIPKGHQKIGMDIRNYSKGIYYLQLIVDDEIFIKQILKN